MTIRLKSMRKTVASFIAVFMAVNIALAGTRALAAEPVSLAAWGASGDSAPVPNANGCTATSGYFPQSVLTNNVGQINYTSNNGLYSSGWLDGAGTKYWQITTSTKGYDNITLSARTRSSGTGPRDFKVVYSVNDSGTWNDIAGSTYAITGSSLQNYMPTISLPNTAADADKLIIRFIMTSNISSRAGTSSYAATDPVGSSGTSSIYNINLSGTPVTNSSTVAGITAAPGNNSAVILGSKVSLSCETAGAAIMYSVNNSSYAVYNPDTQITLTGLPAVIKAYGTKNGSQDSVVSTFNYTQAQAAAVTASPNGGAVALGTSVKLSSATENAVIKYSTDNGGTWKDYSGGVVLNTLPAGIQAKATFPGMLDSAVATFNFTQRINSGYNIYFGQLHSHTTNSDGIGSLDDAYSHARDTAHLDFFAVTDHSNSFDNAASSTMGNASTSTKWLNGHNAADTYTNSNFVGIYGYEMTWSDGTGHINTYNTPGFESRDTQKYKNADGLKQYYNVLKNFPDAISQFNHPGTTFGDFQDFANYDPEIDKDITLLEVGNGEGAVRSSGYFPSYSYYDRALQKGWHVAPTNNQDNHKGLWGDANTARTVVLADTLTRDNIYDAIKNRRTYATEDSNLKIKYTLNNEVMGTIMSQKPGSVAIKVDLEDPDNEALGKISVISNGGMVVASKTLTSSKDTVNFTLAPDYSYYYIRVDEADRDIAVTAPVWIAEVDKAGIAKTTGSTTLPVSGQSLKITSSLYNNEAYAMTITGLQYSINGNVINTASALDPVQSLGTASYSFDYTPAVAGKYKVDVKMIAVINGVEKIFNDVLQLNVADPAVTTKIVVDATHFNDYVYGYYANNLNNFTTLANSEGVSVNIEKTKLTDAVLADAQTLVITAPAKKSGTSNGVTYTPQSFSDEDIAVVKRFVDRGGNLIVCGIADYQDGSGEYQTTTQMNKLLAGINAVSRFNNDEVIDNTNHSGSQNFRLAFDDYNMSSSYLNGVASGQTYSFYSGCSINLDSSALSSGKISWLVKGHNTTESIDSNNKLAGVAMPQGSVYALAVEQLSGGGKMFIGGTVYISDFEIKAQLDNTNQLQNSNYNIAMNILDSTKKVIPITPINVVRSAPMGNVFAVEGTVTAGTQQGNAFFDTIYIQDETGGINIYPVSGMNIKVGQKVRVTGRLDEYQGDRELRVIEISVTDTAQNPITPEQVSTKAAMDSNNGGKLLKVQGTVTKVDIVNNVVSAIYVKDESGVEARLFVDGYIGYSNAGSAKLENIAKVGNVISGIGLASADPDGNRLRVRDRSEILLVSKAPTGDNSGSNNGNSNGNSGSGSNGSSSSVGNLPKTGSMIDFSVIVIAGILILGAGVFVYFSGFRRRRKENSL